MDSSDRLHNTPIHVGIDVGGTFTDFVVWHDGRLRIHKVPTTPDDQSPAILQGLRDLNLLASSPSDPGRPHPLTLSPSHSLTLSLL